MGIWQIWVVLAGFSLNSVNLLTTCWGNSSTPIPEAFNSATSQAWLGDIPSVGHLTTTSIHFDWWCHFKSHGLFNFFSEDKAENSADQHRHEYQKHQNEVLQRKINGLLSKFRNQIEVIVIVESYLEWNDIVCPTREIVKQKWSECNSRSLSAEVARA